MDFKVLIKCEKCKCSFELRPEEFADREDLRCVNCDQKLDPEVFSHLKKGLIELAKVPDNVPNDANLFSLDERSKPQFSLKVKEYDMFKELWHTSQD